MAITLVNRSFSGGSLDNTPFSITPTTPGNSLIIALSIFGSGLGCISCTTNAGDSVPNLPMMIGNPLYPAFNTSGASDNTQILLIPSCAGIATQMTIHCGASFNAWVYEVNAGGQIQTADANFTRSSIHSTTATGPAISSTDPSSFYVSCTTSGPTIAIAPPWTFDQVDTSMGGIVTLSFGAGFYAGTGSQQPVFTLGISNRWSVSAAVFTGASSPTAKLFGLSKLNTQPFDQVVGSNGLITDVAINSTYFTYGFVNSAKAAQNPLLGFHRKRYSEIQSYIRGSGQATIATFPNYILKQDLSFNPSEYIAPPVLLQVDPPDDIVRPLNISGNRVFVMYSTNAVGSAFSLSKTIMVGVMDQFTTVNPNAG